MSVRRPFMLPLVPLYRAGLAARNRRFNRPGNVQTLRNPVLSVGSISAGGAGKTPFLLALAHLLHTHGYNLDILSRGYGRTSKGNLRVDPDGSASDFGDEPLLLAHTLGLPVYVGSSRFAAGQLAEEQSSHRIHLLDDGFSHRALARTADLVLLTAEDACDTLLPAGNLREPLAALRRAHILILREEEAAALHHLVAPLGKPVWIIRRELTLPTPHPRRPLVFSAIARPADFEATLHQQGIVPVATKRYPDHHRYGTADIACLLRAATGAKADGFITTAKDHVKLDRSMLQALAAAGPVVVADLTVHLDQPLRCMQDLRPFLPAHV